jgi:2-keto-4-pentenoate hydratase
MNGSLSEKGAAAARAIREAYRSRCRVAPDRTLLGSAADAAAADAVQQANTEIWLAEGRRLIGRKIGLTAKVVQRQLGVDQPDYGMLFADMCLAPARRLRRIPVLQPRVETEVAVVLERDLTMEQPTVADVIRAIACALPAIEVVGNRIAGWDITLVDTIADNASSGLFVPGGPPRSLLGLDLVGCRMRMTREREAISEGSGAACLGSPLNAAVWLARTMVAGQSAQGRRYRHDRGARPDGGDHAGSYGRRSHRGVGHGRRVVRCRVR